MSFETSFSYRMYINDLQEFEKRWDGKRRSQAYKTARRAEEARRSVVEAGWAAGVKTTPIIGTSNLAGASEVIDWVNDAISQGETFISFDLPREMEHLSSKTIEKILRECFVCFKLSGNPDAGYDLCWT